MLTPPVPRLRADARQRGRCALGSREVGQHIEALRVSETGRADADDSLGVRRAGRRKVVDDVVRTTSIAVEQSGYTTDHDTQMIQIQVVPCSPGDVVIGAGGISTHSDRAENI